MMKISLLLFFMLSLNSYSQTNIFTKNKLVSTIDTLNFKPVNKLKKLNTDQVKIFVNNGIRDDYYTKLINEAVLKCGTNHKQDLLKNYNTHYSSISLEKFDSYCKEILILMKLDETIE